MSKNCNKCSAKIEDNTRFCPCCGANQGKPEPIFTNTSGFVPTLEVFRESSFVGSLFSYRVFVDGVEVGKLKNGEKKRFQIAPGLHEIYIKQNWSWLYSPKVSFLLKDFVKFSCKPKVSFFGSLFGRVGFYLMFKRRKFILLKEA
ncbi:MAG: hypothetical protein H6Q69_2400 [Firmicutes bacterium]|nr:hypothetical protein [Bacillota bacterium]